METPKIIFSQSIRKSFQNAVEIRPLDDPIDRQTEREDRRVKKEQHPDRPETLPGETQFASEVDESHLDHGHQHLLGNPQVRRTST